MWGGEKHGVNGRRRQQTFSVAQAAKLAPSTAGKRRRCAGAIAFSKAGSRPWQENEKASTANTRGSRAASVKPSGGGSHAAGPDGIWKGTRAYMQWQ